MTLRIATTRPLPEPDPDEPLLLEALAARAVDARMVWWRDADEPWEAPGKIVVRSTWDYPRHAQAFIAWIERAQRSGGLMNPGPVLRGNVHKRYLLELAARGISTVPTLLVTASDAKRTVRAMASEQRFEGVVIKPAISAGSFMTKRFDDVSAPEADAHLREVLSGGDALVQPVMREVERSGERALVFIDGQLTHAVRKEPRLAGGEERVHVADIADDERALALAALAPIASSLLYGRVDMVRDGEGRPCIMELELLEPSLFLMQHPPALARLADALAR